MRNLVGELCEKIDWFDKLNGDYKLYHDSDGAEDTDDSSQQSDESASIVKRRHWQQQMDLME